MFHKVWNFEMIDYFPLSTAQGKAFCNRKTELAYLTKNIQMVRPTLLMSPRRYGKTSLVLRTFESNKTIFAYIDFYKEVTEEDIERSIINGIAQLLGKLESKPKQLLRLAGEFFSDFNIKVGLDSIGLSLEAHEKKKNPADTIQKALQKLHDFIEKKKMTVVFYIDEFQRLAEITDNHSIEAAMRHVAQISKNVVYIFSGSNRHLVEKMFFDRDRPFYKLCDTMHLERIASEHYYPYLQKASHRQWGKNLPDKIIEIILSLTENHPYYVNLLCSKLWSHQIPTSEKQVMECWNNCALENKPLIEKDIDFLSFNQKKLLISFAKFGPTDTPTGQFFLNAVNMSSTSLSQALSVLVERDYLYKDKQGFYRILDPLIHYALS